MIHQLEVLAIVIAPVLTQIRYNLTSCSYKSIIVIAPVLTQIRYNISTITVYVDSVIAPVLTQIRYNARSGGIQ